MRKGQSNNSSLGRLFKFIISESGWSLAIVIVLIVASTICTLMMTIFLRTLIDDYIIPLSQSVSPDFSPLAIALVKLSAVLLVGILADFISSLLMIKVGQGVMMSLRRSVFDHLQTLSLRYFDSRAAGDIMSVFTNDIETLRQVIGRTIPQLFSAVISIVSVLVSMIVMSLPLTLAAIVWTFVLLKASMTLGMKSRKYFGLRQKNMALVNGFIEEMVSGQKVVKVFCHEDKATEQFELINEQLRQSVYDANRIANYIMPVNVNLTNVGYALLAIGGAAICILFDNSSLTVGALVSFLTLYRNFTRPINQLSMEINSIAMAGAGTERVYSILDQDKETDAGEVTLEKVEGRWIWKDGEKKRALEGEVSLRNVDFGYTEEKKVLHDISLTAYPGQKVAFVGGTGAGKTTITNLINRFYDIQQGTITYDGIDISRIQKSSLRQSLGIVLQDTHLFTGTIMDNIRYGRLDATENECIAAAKLAFAHSFIKRLPEGYNTMITGDGDNLSQGERQLLSIARTAVADPPVLILDEATSSIDTRTEKLIQASMDRIMKGRTTLVIAHRLSTVQNADYIVVLDHGRIIEAGKHQELLEQKGKYYELFTGSR